MTASSSTARRRRAPRFFGAAALALLLAAAVTCSARADEPRAPSSVPSLVAPDTLFIGITRVGTLDSAIVPLLNAGAERLIVDSIYLERDDNRLALAEDYAPERLDSGESKQVVIRFSPLTRECTGNALYVRITDIEGGDEQLYRIGMSACSGAPVLQNTPPTLVFSRVLAGTCEQRSASLANVGEFPLRLGRISTFSAEFTVELDAPAPLTLAPGEGIGLTVTYCPPANGLHIDSVVSECDALMPSPLRLLGDAVVPSIAMLDTVDFGGVPIARRRDTVILIRATTAAVRVARPSIAQAPPGTTFRVRDEEWSGGDIAITPDSPQPITLSFCPRELAESVGDVTFVVDGGETRGVIVRGTGTSPEIWLDTVAAQAGRELELRLRVAPGLDTLYALGGIRAVMTLDRHALHPKGATSSVDASVAMSTGANGLVELVFDVADTRLVDGELARLRLRGLITGSPSNVVSLDTASIEAFGNALVRADGLVRLAGCFDPSAPGFRRQSIIDAIDVRGDEVIVTYRLASGADGWLELFDVRGTRIRSIRLDATGDALRSATLPLTDIERGVYLVRIRSGAIVVSQPIGVSR